MPLNPDPLAREVTAGTDGRAIYEVVEAGATYYVASPEHMIVHALREGTLRVQ